MQPQRMRRKHLRAPLKTEFLYVSDEYVLKGRVNNISEGGILLSEIAQVPPVNSIPIMVEIPEFPDFQKLGADRILKLKKEAFGRSIVRFRCAIRRKWEGASDVEKVFVTNIGCQFVNPTVEQIEVVRQYVSLFARNTIYLLQLFESMGKSKTQKEVLRNVSHFLGYSPTEKLSSLRQKVLHDYQSLESL